MPADRCSNSSASVKARPARPVSRPAAAVAHAATPDGAAWSQPWFTTDSAPKHGLAGPSWKWLCAWLLARGELLSHYEYQLVDAIERGNGPTPYAYAQLCMLARHIAHLEVQRAAGVWHRDRMGELL